MSMSNILKIGLYACNTNSPLTFRRRVLLFGIMVAFGVYITQKASDHLYRLGVKGQCHIYIKSV